MRASPPGECGDTNLPFIGVCSLRAGAFDA
jgi:hypothetical protein